MSEPDSLWLAAYVVIAFLTAGTVKGILGLGLPTVSLGFLGLALPPTQAASLVIAAALVTNVWQFLAGPETLAVARRLAPMMLAMVLGVWFGVDFMIGAQQAVVGMALGVLLIVYALLSLKRVVSRLPVRYEAGIGPAAGVLTGFLAGATGVMSMPGLAYLQAIGLERRLLVQALGLMFSVGTLALGALLWVNSSAWNALPRTTWLTLSVLATIAGLVGMRIGQALEKRLSGLWFRRLFSAWLVVIGVAIIWRNIGN
ncbi:MAG: TSUP family transporter [Burkholderiaceae bacterium]